MNTDLTEFYEKGLAKAKKIMAYAAQYNYTEVSNELYEGWQFLNFLVREAEKDYEKYKKSLR